jgi:hypothetical protein
MFQLLPNFYLLSFVNLKLLFIFKGPEQKLVNKLPLIQEDRIAIFHDHSHGKDKLIKFTGTNNVLCIQDKNKELSFNNVEEKVESIKRCWFSICI